MKRAPLWVFRSAGPSESSCGCAARTDLSGPSMKELVSSPRRFGVEVWGRNDPDLKH
jgi:hypothetical protein